MNKYYYKAFKELINLFLDEEGHHIDILKEELINIYDKNYILLDDEEFNDVYCKKLFDERFNNINTQKVSKYFYLKGLNNEQRTNIGIWNRICNQLRGFWQRD